MNRERGYKDKSRVQVIRNEKEERKWRRKLFTSRLTKILVRDEVNS